MLCDVCNENDVAITLTEIDGDGVRQVRLCERCAADRGEQAAIVSPKPELQAAIVTPKPELGSFVQSVHQQVNPLKGDATQCTFCGATLRDFRQTGRLGCAHCYQAFERGLRDLLRRVHGSSRHMGRMYDTPLDEHTLATSSAHQLRDRMQRAIELEQFELAATLRDQLKALE
jgi:protein arginine kinase activator